MTFSGCPGDSETATHPNWVTTPWPPEFLEVLEWQWDKKAIPYWTKPQRSPRSWREGGARGASGLHRLQRGERAQAADACGDNLGVNFDPEPSLLAGSGRADGDPRARRRNLSRARERCYLDRQNVAVNGVLDIKTYRRMAERSWLFRSVGWGHDEFEWKRIVSALRLAGYDYVMSIEHEDALASIDEGLKAAIDVLSARSSPNLLSKRGGHENEGIVGVVGIVGLGCSCVRAVVPDAVGAGTGWRRQFPRAAARSGRPGARHPGRVDLRHRLPQLPWSGSSRRRARRPNLLRVTLVLNDREGELIKQALQASHKGQDQ